PHTPNNWPAQHPRAAIYVAAKLKLYASVSPEPLSGFRFILNMAQAQSPSSGNKGAPLTLSPSAGSATARVLTAVLAPLAGR
ncbi:MAG: hypothetical protein VX228_13520, partial [Pseudomonadota bacterium]|nr:hypothetical protein [Pseudomonadota bacterium]